MKLTYVFLTIVICLSAVSSYAQVHQAKDLNVNAGLGFGSVNYGGMSLNGSVEYALSDELSLGGAIGYNTYSSDYDYFFSDRLRISVFYFGPRGTYHFADALDLDTDQFDLYAGAFVGVAVVKVSYLGESVSGFAGPGSFGYDFFGGARYYFNPNIAVYGELGVGISILQMGITFKL